MSLDIKHIAMDSDGVEPSLSWVKFGFNVGMRNTCGFNFIHIAVLCNIYNLVEYLSRNEEDVSVVFKGNENQIQSDNVKYKGYTPLHFAVEKEHIRLVELLVSRNADLNALSYLHGWSPLHIAVLTKNTAIIEVLLKAGANVNIRTQPRSEHLKSKPCVENTPLHYAVLLKNIADILLLVEYGADASAFNSCGDSPFHIACRSDYEDFDLLMRTNHIHENSNFTETNQVLPKFSNDQFTRLCLTKPDLAIIFILTKTGICIDHKNSKNKKTSMHMVIGTDKDLVKQFLVTQGCDLYAKDACNNTLLHFAAVNQECYLLESVLLAGVDPLTLNEENQTAFKIACHKGNADAVSILLHTGHYIDIGRRNSHDYQVAQENLEDLFMGTDECLQSVAFDYLVKMTALGYVVPHKLLCEVDKSEWYSVERTYRYYKKRVMLLKKRKIRNTALTHYDVCKLSVEQLMLYLDYAEVKKFMYKTVETYTFDGFSKMMRFKLKQAFVRKSLLDKCKRCFQDGNLNVSIPPECIKMIFNMLENKDLFAFIKGVTGRRVAIVQLEGLLFETSYGI